jgi:hypothetical protein
VQSALLILRDLGFDIFVFTFQRRAHSRAVLPPLPKISLREPRRAKKSQEEGNEK